MKFKKVSVLCIKVIKEGLFVGSKICELILDDEFKRKPKPSESVAWEALVQVVQNLLWNHRAENFAKIKSTNECKMSLKMHFCSPKSGQSQR